MSSRLLNLPTLPKWWKSGFNYILIILLSIVIHIWCVWQLPIDFDEPIYVQAGGNYAQLIRSGDISGIINFPENREHPPLVKILYSIPYLLIPDSLQTNFYIFSSRAISALFGVIAVAIVAKKNLWAGLFLCFHSMTIKYTSQAYLEALPMLMVIIAVLTLERSNEKNKQFFWISSIALGIAGAAKYPYLLIVVVIIAMFFIKKIFSFKFILGYFSLALVTFILLNPTLWNEPLSQIREILNFHASYSQSFHVQNYGYPWYQQIIHMSSSVQWHPQVFFFLTSDELVFGLALIGLYFEGKEKKFTAVWLVIGILFLLIWPTKWPQYTLFVTPVLSLVAGATVSRAINWLKPKEDYWNYFEEMLPQPPKITWWVLGIFVSILVLGKIVFEYQLAISRQGWSIYNQENSPLSSDIVYQINTEKPGMIGIATDKGFDIWEQDSNINIWGNNPQNFSTINSDLNTNTIRKIVYDGLENVYWLGTDLGVSKFSNQVENFTRDDIGCEDCQVNDMLLDSDSNLWIATNDGIYQKNQNQWEKFSEIYKGLENTTVLSIYLDEEDNNKILWAGTLTGISKFIFSRENWVNENWAGNYFGWGGVSEIDKLTDNKIAACTLGGGIFFWDGTDWEYFRNTNAPLKSNTVLSVKEDNQSNIWLGLGYPTEPGGYLMKYEKINSKWTRFQKNNSGFSEGEPLDIQFDDLGRMWISTNGAGIQTYFLSK